MAAQRVELETEREFRIYEENEARERMAELNSIRELAENSEQQRLDSDYKKFLLIWNGSGKEHERMAWSKLKHSVRELSRVLMSPD
jgi:hypothetical protein